MSAPLTLAPVIDPDSADVRSLDDVACEIACCLERLSSAEWALCAAQQLTGDGYEHAAVLARTEIQIAWETLDAIRLRVSRVASQAGDCNQRGRS